jgi:hypothetical protein
MVRRAEIPGQNPKDIAVIVTDDGQTVRVEPGRIIAVTEVEADERHLIGNLRTRRTMDGKEYGRESLRGKKVDDPRLSN